MHIISCGQVRFTSRQEALIKKEGKNEVVSYDLTITNITKNGYFCLFAIAVYHHIYTRRQVLINTETRIGSCFLFIIYRKSSLVFVIFTYCFCIVEHNTLKRED